MIGEHAIISKPVLARRRYEADEMREEAMGLELDIGCARAAVCGTSLYAPEVAKLVAVIVMSLW